MLHARRLSGQRLRCHGSLRLDTMMRAERGLVMIDFEGDPGRPTSERRLKRSPIRDVASMIHSIGDVALTRVGEPDEGGAPRPRGSATLDAWSTLWHRSVAAAFLGGYREAAGAAEFLPATDEEWTVLLDAFLIERGLAALWSNLAADPDRAPATLHGLAEMLG